MTWTLGKVIQDKLNERGWTAKDLADRIKMSPSTLSVVIHGESPKSGEELKVTADTIERIAKGLQVPPLDLFMAYLGKDPRNIEDIRKQYNVYDELERLALESGVALADFSEEEKQQILTNVIQVNRNILKVLLKYEIDRSTKQKH